MDRPTRERVQHPYIADFGLRLVDHGQFEWGWACRAYGQWKSGKSGSSRSMQLIIPANGGRRGLRSGRVHVLGGRINHDLAGERVESREPRGTLIDLESTNEPRPAGIARRELEDSVLCSNQTLLPVGAT